VGVLKGSVTYSKLYVRGALPADVHARFLERIRARGFKPLVPEDEDDAAVGWVPIERPYDDPQEGLGLGREGESAGSARLGFDASGVFFGSYLNLGMRLDRWKFPAALIKARMAAAERELKLKTGKERISKLEKAELKEMVLKKLRRDGVPVSSFADFSWSLETGELRFFSKSKAHLEYFYELFEKTFQLRLLPSGCYVGAVAVGALPSQLEAATPTPFALRPPPSASEVSS
jgi:hypothetical protein